MKQLSLLFALVPAVLLAQSPPPPLLTPQDRKQAAPAPLPGKAPQASELITLPMRNIGPTTMGGRVTDIAVYEKEPRIFYVGAASGGVWRTDNGGITFRPVFYKEGSSNIGAVAVSQTDPNIVWVGTGEGTSRNSAAWGDGIYKSTDGGGSWQKMGLDNTYHFSRIVIDPRDNNTVYAGALGSLWGFNKDRGVYKTTDAGKTWKKVLYVDDKTGVADIQMDPSNPKVLLAAMWEHLRKPYTWISGGPGSGLYKSSDAGATWHKVTGGFPKGDLGRIGLSFFRKDPRLVIASIENRAAPGVYRSTDRGDTWHKVNQMNQRPFYFSIPRQDPNDRNRIYMPAVALYYSDDGGENFRGMHESVHVDHHAMWIDPNDSNHLIIGEDGGVAQSRDRGATWEHLNYMAIGQFYAVAADMRKPYWVYGGLQDNGSWAGPTQTARGGVAYYDFYGIGGGDGFHVQVDPDDWTTVYSESQGGSIQRIDQKFGGGKFIQPRPPKGEKYRFNWSTPFIISPHNSKTVYMGGNRLFKSVDRGDNWNPVSPDLTLNDPLRQTAGRLAVEGQRDKFIESVTPEDTGAERHDTIITISESPVKQGLLWVGTDDGLVKTTDDDGAHWSDVTKNVPGLPANTWVSRVAASRFAEGRCYATFDGHRSNDFSTYVYVTEDKGKTWAKLNANLPPNEPCYVITEGLRNPDLLFLGTEFSLYISLDRGKSWTRYRQGEWPTVAVHDVIVHPRDGDLIVGTHGRSIWTMPENILEELTQDNLNNKDAFVAKPAPIYTFGRMSNNEWQGDRVWVSKNTQPGTTFAYYLRTPHPDAHIVVADAAGNEITDITGPSKAGVNFVEWSARNRGRTIAAGDYRVTLKTGGKEYVTSVKVEDVTDTQNASPPRLEGIAAGASARDGG